MFRRRNRRALTTSVVACGLLLASCGGGGGGGTTKTSTDGKIEVNAFDPYRFDVKTINASAGQLTVTLHEKGSQRHTFTVPDLHFEIAVTGSNPTATGSMTLEAGKTYPFKCSFDGHAAAGMVGQIVVK